MKLGYLTGVGQYDENDENRAILLNVTQQMFRIGSHPSFNEVAAMTPWEHDVLREAYELVKTEERTVLMVEVVKTIEALLK